jgi:hypothetical protein
MFGRSLPKVFYVSYLTIADCCMALIFIAEDRAARGRPETITGLARMASLARPCGRRDVIEGEMAGRGMASTSLA